MTKLLLIIILCFIATAANAADVEYVKQLLEPLGGKIDRPKEWHYTEGHKSQSWLWTISRENAEGGAPYDVGVRIQAALHVQKITGKSPRQFILDLKAQKSKAADKVITECGEANQGLFSRVCLETEEGRFHVLYSLFWGNGMDVIVITTSGAPKEEWQQYENVFNHMAAFELIDMSRFEEK